MAPGTSELQEVGNSAWNQSKVKDTGYCIAGVQLFKGAEYHIPYLNNSNSIYQSQIERLNTISNKTKVVL
jgi:hypothetical protein